MKNKICSYPLLAAALPLVLGILLVAGVAQAKTVSKTAKAGVYSVNLKVLPAESFTGTKAEMVRDGGAEPNTLNGPEHPNHHMVAFVKENGKPVENAQVEISYRQLSPKMGTWMTLPVVRMHVSGHGLETTHYGNNVRLTPGRYEVHVTVNGNGPASFRFSLSR